MNPDDIQKQYSQMKPQNPSVEFRDGFLSIQASSFNYCHPKHDHGPYTCFEVAYLLNDSVFANIPELQDTTLGYLQENTKEVNTSMGMSFGKNITYNNF